MTLSSLHAVPENAERQDRLREWLESLRALAESPIDVRRFYGEWLVRVSKAVGGDTARVWCLEPSGRWEPALALGALRPTEDADTQARREQLLNDVAKGGQSVATLVTQLNDVASLPDGGAQPTGSAFWHPVTVAGALRGVIEVRVPVVTRAAQEGILKFMGQAGVLAERFHLLADRRELSDMAALAEQERRLFIAVHRHLELNRMARTLADDGRALTGCDRLTVLVRRGRRQRVVAVSAQQDVDSRSGVVRALSDLATRAMRQKKDFTFPDPEHVVDDATTEVLERYVDEHDVKRVVVMPVKSPVEKDRQGRDVQRIIGTIIAEYFRGAEVSVPDQRRLETVVRCASTAIGNSVTHESLFLHGLWKRLGRAHRLVLEPGTRRRTALIGIALTAAIAALVFVPIADTTYCRGTLQPAARRNVFAPLDGTVRRMFVKHGDRVVKGQPLLELRNTDLDIAAADIEGRRTSLAEQKISVERALLDDRGELPPQERARLSSEQSQIREQLRSLSRQAELFAEKRRHLTVVSPVDGEVTTWNADHLLENRPVRQGQVLLTLAAVGGDWELELAVPDDRSGRVIRAAADNSSPLVVRFSPALDPALVHDAEVVEIQNSAELRGTEGSTVLVRAAVSPQDATEWRPGAEVAAQIQCGTRSLGYVWSRDITDFFRAKVLFRWF
ncbi:MAG: hypothetical protein C0483_17725 [Pirellula sp.]|nr:hypothetical protein [Pirellula sp.]